MPLSPYWCRFAPYGDPQTLTTSGIAGFGQVQNLPGQGIQPTLDKTLILCNNENVERDNAREKINKINQQVHLTR